MSLQWTDDLAGVDWDELEALYRAAPLGDKSAADLKLVFENSRFRLLIRDADTLVAPAGFWPMAAIAPISAISPCCRTTRQGTRQGNRGAASHRKIILYAVPGKEPFYEAFGFRRMTTAMAIFENPDRAHQTGYLERP